MRASFIGRIRAALRNFRRRGRRPAHRANNTPEILGSTAAAAVNHGRLKRLKVAGVYTRVPINAGRFHRRRHRGGGLHAGGLVYRVKPVSLFLSLSPAASLGESRTRSFEKAEHRAKN